MQEISDTELLRQYADSNSEPAFTALVTRYINLVYSAAVRKTGNPHAAEEIAQAVFIILAQKAKAWRKETILSGWLYQTTRLMAANFLRVEIRRSRREQEAYMQSLSNEKDLWQQVEPLLDDAMGLLSEKDRNAIVLRFFEKKSFQEVGAAFGISENAAKKRIIRGLEKLRKSFTQRGVSSSAVVIAAAFSANSVHAAPIALTKTISAAAVVKGATASASTLTLIKGGLKLMAWTKMKTTLAVGAVALLAAVTTTTITYMPTLRAHALASRNLARAQSGVAIAPQAIVQAAANSKILIFRDVRSWDRNPDFEEDLTDLHFKYTVKSSQEMAATDLSGYDVVIIPGAQWNTGYYPHYLENAALFDHYVSNGGTLLLELNGAEHSHIPLPGGVRMVSHGAVDNLLAIPEHPVLLPLGGKPIHAHFASHGYLTDVPKDAMILITEMNKQGLPVNRPTFVEYGYGSGRVIAACQCFHDRDGSGRGPLMATAVEYAAVKHWFLPK